MLGVLCLGNMYITVYLYMESRYERVCKIVITLRCVLSDVEDLYVGLLSCYMMRGKLQL